MADLIFGCHEVNVISPPVPKFKVKRPVTTVNVVLPVQGPPGPAGDIENLQWDLIQNKPALFPPAPHMHPQTDVVNLVTTLNDISASTHSADDMPDLTTYFENAIA